MIDLFFRCFSRDRWLALATNRNILDAEGNPREGFAVDELGNIIITPGDPPVFDTWWTVNLRIFGAKASEDEDTLFPGETDGLRFVRSKLARFVREQGTLVTVRGMRAYQFGAAANRVQLFDSRDMVNPPRVWLGGMSL